MFLLCLVCYASLASFLQGADITTSCEQKYVDQVQGKVTCVLDRTVITAKCAAEPTTVTFKFQENGQSLVDWCFTSYTACAPGTPRPVCNGCTCGCEDASNPTGSNYTLTFTPDTLTHNLGSFECVIDCVELTPLTRDHSSCSAIPVGERSCINCTCTQCNCTLTPEGVTGIVVGIEILIGAIGITANILRYYEKPNIHRGYYIAAFVIFNVAILIDVIVGPVVYTNQDCCKVNCCEDNCCEDSNCQYDCCKFSTGRIVTILLPTVAVIGALTASFIICLLKWNCQCCEGSNIGPRDNINHETQPSNPESRVAVALVTRPAPEPEKKTPKLENESGGANGQGRGAVHNGADNNSSKKKKKRKPEKETTEMTGLKETSSPSDEEPVMRPLPQPITGDNATPRLPPLPSSGGLTSVERNSYAESQPRKLPLPDIAPSNKE